MFCYQCEQAAKGIGCTTVGICGKDPNVAFLQDLLIYAVKGISVYAHRIRRLGIKDHEIDRFITKALFSTVTNVNFDDERMSSLLYEADGFIKKARQLYSEACGSQKDEIASDNFPAQALWEAANDIGGLIKQGEKVGIELRKKQYGDDIAGLQELLLYGLKGMCAYAHHAMRLGVEDDEVYAFLHEALDVLTHEPPKQEILFEMVLNCGKANLRVMQLLDHANTSAYGNPVPTKVRITPVKGKAILVSGHDLKDMEEILKQTENLGINVYTHGEMLPAHGYPGLKKYHHLVGNYGGAWQDQKKEFDAFPGAIVMTTNCIQKPLDSYRHRIFTSGLVAMPGVKHINDMDFSPAIDAALREPGFAEDGEDKTIIVGFGHNALIERASKVIEAVKSGKIRHFFLVGGCDGAKSGRNYYTDFAQLVPKDCVIITLACGKFRFNKLELGEIDGIPRLLDCGQCNDAYSAIQVAIALAKAFNVEVNDLPLSLVLSWYEQKAVCILLTLLYLGIKNIRLGPSLPAFITPSTLQVLVSKFNIKPITDARKDIEDILGERV